MPDWFPTGPDGGGGGAVSSVTTTSPILNNGTAADPIIAIEPSTTVMAGSMSAADNAKLAAIAAGATNTPLSVTTPVAVGAAAVGIGTTAARADHVHAHGNQAGGALHSDVVSGGASGFMDGARAAKVDAIAAGATNTPLSATTPANVGTAAVGVGTTAARADHVHALPNVGAGAGATAYPTSITVDAQGRITVIAADGSIVTLTGTQTLTNKSIDAGQLTGTVLDARLPTTMGGKTLTTATLTTPAISSPALSGTSTGAGLIAKANGGLGVSVATGLTPGQGVYVDASGVLQIGRVPIDYQAVFQFSTSNSEFAFGPALAPIVLNNVSLPIFIPVRAGTIFGLDAYSNAVGVGDSITFRIKKSVDQGANWTLLSPSVSCVITAGNTTASDTTNYGVVAPGDWIVFTVQSTLSANSYTGGINVKLRYN